MRSKEANITQFVVVHTAYTTVSDVSVEIFAGT